MCGHPVMRSTVKPRFRPVPQSKQSQTSPRINLVCLKQVCCLTSDSWGGFWTTSCILHTNAEKKPAGSYQMSNRWDFSKTIFFYKRVFQQEFSHTFHGPFLTFLLVFNQITGRLTGIKAHTPCLRNAISCHSCDSLNLEPSTFSNKASKVNVCVCVQHWKSDKYAWRVRTYSLHATFGHFLLISRLMLWKAAMAVEFTILSALKTHH